MSCLCLLCLFSCWFSFCLSLLLSLSVSFLCSISLYCVSLCVSVCLYVLCRSLSAGLSVSLCMLCFCLFLWRHVLFSLPQSVVVVCPLSFTVYTLFCLSLSVSVYVHLSAFFFVSASLSLCVCSFRICVCVSLCVCRCLSSIFLCICSSFISRVSSPLHSLPSSLSLLFLRVVFPLYLSIGCTLTMLFNRLVGLHFALYFACFADIACWCCLCCRRWKPEPRWKAESRCVSCCVPFCVCNTHTTPLQ